MPIYMWLAQIELGELLKETKKGTELVRSGEIWMESRVMSGDEYDQNTFYGILKESRILLKTLMREQWADMMHCHALGSHCLPLISWHLKSSYTMKH